MLIIRVDISAIVQTHVISDTDCDLYLWLKQLSLKKTTSSFMSVFKVIKYATSCLKHSGKIYLHHLSRNDRIMLSIKWYLLHLK